MVLVALWSRCDKPLLEAGDRICKRPHRRRIRHSELAAVGIELIEESEQPAVADAFDYYYVPTFYVDGVKVHEGGIYPEEVEKILRSALE